MCLKEKTVALLLVLRFLYGGLGQNRTADTRIFNPQSLAKLGPNEPVFVLPHLGPEELTVVDSHHVVVVNDTNFPLSSVRTMGQPDHNELTLLNIKALVEAR